MGSPPANRPTVPDLLTQATNRAREAVYAQDAGLPEAETAALTAIGPLLEQATLLYQRNGGTPAANGTQPAAPANLDAEESVLGAMMLSTKAVGAVADAVSLPPSAFYRESHALTYKAILSLYAKGEPTDAIAVVDELDRTRTLDRAGGPERIHELAALVPAAGNAPHYAAIVLEMATLRGLIRAGQEIARLGYERPGEIETLLLRAQETLAFAADPELATGNQPLFADAHEFAAEQVDTPLPLWGTPELTIIPAGGLCLLAGRPGCGKTTWMLDLACHLAQGLPYPPVDTGNPKAPPPLAAPRPLTVAIVENEGPREMFRAKLAAKLAQHPELAYTAGRLIVQTWRWGSFSFADPVAQARAARELEQQQVDLVIGDPLATLGPEGVGSPEDTRRFVQALRPLGLGINRAFLFLHHFRERVEKTDDELARISGAWGGHLDTLITLANTDKNDQARLAWPKVRWATRTQPQPIILGRIYNRAGYEAIAVEGDPAILEPRLYATLADARARGAGRQGHLTVHQIGTALEIRRSQAKAALEGAPHLFRSRTGDEARTLGARSNSVLWGLAEWADTDTEPPEPTPDNERLPFS